MYKKPKLDQPKIERQSSNNPTASSNISDPESVKSSTYMVAGSGLSMLSDKRPIAMRSRETDPTDVLTRGDYSSSCSDFESLSGQKPAKLVRFTAQSDFTKSKPQEPECIVLSDYDVLPEDSLSNEFKGRIENSENLKVNSESTEPNKENAYSSNEIKLHNMSGTPRKRKLEETERPLMF